MQVLWAARWLLKPAGGATSILLMCRVSLPHTAVCCSAPGDPTNPPSSLSLHLACHTGNVIGPGSVQHLLAGCAACPTLRTLNLQGTFSLAGVASRLTTHTGSFWLLLAAGNQLGKLGATGLAAGLRWCPALTNLGVGGMPLL